MADPSHMHGSESTAQPSYCARGRPARARVDPPQPLETTDLADFKVTPDRLDEALRVLQKVLEEDDVQCSLKNTER